MGLATFSTDPVY